MSLTEAIEKHPCEDILSQLCIFNKSLVSSPTPLHLNLPGLSHLSTGNDVPSPVPGRPQVMQQKRWLARSQMFACGAAAVFFPGAMCPSRNAWQTVTFITGKDGTLLSCYTVSKGTVTLQEEKRLTSRTCSTTDRSLIIKNNPSVSAVSLILVVSRLKSFPLTAHLRGLTVAALHGSGGSSLSHHTRSEGVHLWSTNQRWGGRPPKAQCSPECQMLLAIKPKSA